MGKKRKYRILMSRISFCFIVLLSTISLAKTAQLPEGFVEKLIAENLDPTKMAIAPDGRLFLTEKNGLIHIIENDILLPEPFLDLEVDFFNERGISGIAIDPDFNSNGFVYIYYSVVDENRNRLSRFTAIGNKADITSEHILVEFDPLGGSIHNGGEMHFGPDGMLYIGIGDGANSIDVPDMDKYTGKVIRIRPDGSIPQDNPFFDNIDVGNKAIWSLGYRNPYTFAIQQSTGDIYLNDVGSFAWEEINLVKPGDNHGWPNHEGNSGDIATYQRPFYTYSHEDGCAIIGATFYSPDDLYIFPQKYHDKYFFGDYCNGTIRYMDVNNPDQIDTFITDIDRPISIITAPNGDMYYIERAGLGGGSMEDNTSSTNGRLWKVSYRGDGSPFISVEPKNQSIPKDENICFTTIAIGDNLSYQWYENTQAIDQAITEDHCIEEVTLAIDGYQYYCLITDGQVTISTDTVSLTVLDNERPTVDIQVSLSENRSLYHAGDTIWYSGAGTDPEDGVLSGDFYTWKLDFHHDEHTHPVFSGLQGEQGFFVIPRDGETSPNVFYRLSMIAEDSDMLTGVGFMDIFPKITTVTVDCNVASTQVLVDGRAVETPYSYESVVGLRRYLSAGEKRLSDKEVFFFKEWINGSTDKLTIFDVPAQDTTISFELETFNLGEGQGLQGYYWDTIPEIGEDFFKYSQLDEQIDFDWGIENPEELSEDFFAISWIGKLKAYFEGEYTIRILSDDGVRLYVDGELLIDQYVGQPSTWTSTKVNMLKEQELDIRLDYHELTGGASVALYWSSDRFAQELIPTKQLIPGNLYPPLLQNSEAVILAPNPVDDLMQIGLTYESLDQGKISVYNLSGQQVLQLNFEKTNRRMIKNIDTSRLPAGRYVLKIESEIIEEIYPFIKI